MNVTGRSGITITEVVVVLFVLCLFSAVLFPPGFHSGALTQANMTAAGTRGKDIYVSIIHANTDRALQGFAPVWPANGEEFDFPNSTDYFRHLYDERHVGTETWNPLASGFDYSKLAGAKVPQCAGKTLTADCNMWTVAKNVRNDMDEMLPVLVTRNVDARSLASEETSWELERKPFFDDDWLAPFGTRGLVMIRKGGAVFKAKSKYATYQVVYQRPGTRPSEDAEAAALAEVRRQSGKPLKYLTPTREVVPGDTAYAECLEEKGTWTIKRAKRDLIYLKEISVPIAVFWLMPCLVVFAFQHNSRRKAGDVGGLWQTAIAGFGQYCALVLYTALMHAWSEHAELWLSVFAIAMIVQASVIASVIFARPDDWRKRWDGVKCVLVTVLIAMLGMLLVSIFLCSF